VTLRDDLYDKMQRWKAWGTIWEIYVTHLGEVSIQKLKPAPHGGTVFAKTWVDFADEPKFQDVRGVCARITPRPPPPILPSAPACWFHRMKRGYKQIFIKPSIQSTTLLDLMEKRKALKAEKALLKKMFRSDTEFHDQWELIEQPDIEFTTQTIITSSEVESNDITTHSVSMDKKTIKAQLRKIEKELEDSKILIKTHIEREFF
jgi:hypothetical protein